MMITLEALMNGKRTFLEQEEWKTIPWALEPASKTSLSLIQDIICDLPGLLASAKSLKTVLAEDGGMEKHRILCNEVLKRVSQAFHWRAIWEQNHPLASLEVPGGGDPALEDYPSLRKSPFPTVIHFRSLIEANEIALYTTTVLILMRSAQSLIGEAFSISALAHDLPFFEKTNPLLLPGDNFSTRDLAIEICRFADYHMLKVHKSAGSYQLLFPLRVAFQTLASESKVADWLQLVMEEIADSDGFGISRSLSN